MKSLLATAALLGFFVSGASAQTPQQTMNWINGVMSQGNDPATKSMESACMRTNDKRSPECQAYFQRQQRITDGMNAQMGVLGAMNADQATRNSVARSNQQMLDNNRRANDRMNAQGYYGYADQDRRKGDTYNAQRWQNQGDAATRDADDE